jgi:ribosome-associated heat shock protein Hsp15
MSKVREETPAVRLDKWLWAARFFKTRSLATAAIDGGKVQLDGQRVKPSREVKLGMELTVHNESGERVVIVCGLSATRRPAVEAAALYQETPQSIARREREAEQRRAAVAQRERGAGRPTKKDRRQIRRFVER